MGGAAVVLPRDGDGVAVGASLEVPGQASRPEAVTEDVETRLVASYQLVVVHVEHEVVARASCPVEGGGGCPCRVVRHRPGEGGAELPCLAENLVRAFLLGMLGSGMLPVVLRSEYPVAQSFVTDDVA